MEANKTILQRIREWFGGKNATPATTLVEPVKAPEPETNKMYPYVVKLRWPGYPIIKMRVMAATAQSAKDTALSEVIRKMQINATLHD